MMSAKNNNLIITSMIFFYAAFLFLMPLLGGLGKVNNTFHIALILSVVFLLSNKNIRKEIFSSAEIKTGLVITSIFLFYYSISGLWNANSETLVSDLTHSVYIIFFMAIFYIISFYNKKNLMLAMVFSSIVILCLLTFFYVNKHTLLHNRLERAFPLAPENVIDMAGYFGVGIFCGLILLRETGKKWLYLPIAMLFVAILLTQSRGPLFSLIIALAPMMLLIKRLHRKDWLIIGLILLAIGLGMVYTNSFDVLIARIQNSYSQSFVRFGIWENALSYIQQKPWFGWGFGQELNFVNEIGQRVHTTHSLYFSSLLKGGIVGGLMLLVVIGYGFYLGWQHIKAHQALEASMFLFVLLFYTTQGMFLIGNPGTSWVMFWLPLAIIMVLPKRQ
ncbi:O-antigen ligase family protein [Erwinia sp. J316]|uniref:O-antigen ligase family protein n=1 Tax=Erwinia sorbitola TaxID=2681984 RepID=A0ABW9RFV1_9GAMM|nr:O-antigen ligase family protein [Erwinia sorbitola]